MGIERAKPEDLRDLIPGALNFYASSRHLRVFDPERFLAMWTALLSGDTAVIFLQRAGARIAGAIGGVIYPEQYSGELIAQEFFWFVEAEYRGGPGLRLYRAFECWARDRKCTEVRMGHLLDLMPEKLEAVYHRLGFEAIEINYAKRLQCGANEEVA